MAVKVTSQPKDGYVLIESTGTIENAEELLLQADLIYEEIERYEFLNVLVYEPELKLPDDLTPYFDLVKKYAQSDKKVIREIKMAVVVADRYKEVGASWETISQSLGLKFYMFTSMKEAEECLKREDDCATDQN